jgi:hypothetical protein
LLRSLTRWSKRIGASVNWKKRVDILLHPDAEFAEI